MREVTFTVVVGTEGGVGEVGAVTVTNLSGPDRFSRYEGDRPYALAAEEGEMELEFPNEESMKRDVSGCS